MFLLILFLMENVVINFIKYLMIRKINGERKEFSKVCVLNIYRCVDDVIRIYEIMDRLWFLVIIL